MLIGPHLVPDDHADGRVNLQFSPLLLTMLLVGTSPTPFGHAVGRANPHYAMTMLLVGPSPSPNNHAVG